ncbi:hypothetical protein BH10BAC2_BH10BAC2_10330 [soil metagenome]
MKSIFLIAFSLLSLIVEAQDYYKIRPTKFDTFVNSPNISWAHRINAKYFLKKDNFNLWDYLTDSWQNNTLPVFNRDSSWQYHEFDSLRDQELYNRIIELKKFYTPKILFDFRDSNKCIENDQIFYVEGNKLKSAIVSATIAFPYAFQDGGIFLYTPSFYSCINEHPNNTANLKDLYDLGMSSFKLTFREEGLFMLDYPNTSNDFKVIQLKRTYNHDLRDILWQFALDKKVKVFDPKNQKEINGDSLETYPFFPNVIQKTIDTKTNPIDSFYVKRPVSPGDITSINISQHFYFDKKRNILFSNIDEVYIFTRNYDNFTFENQELCIARIEF